MVVSPISEALSYWHGSDELTEMVVKFRRMLEDGREIFKSACSVLEGAADPDEVSEALYLRDKLINGNERNIRGLIVDHLRIRPRASVSLCLALMSVVKDAERIGDYGKNIFEVARMGRESLNKSPYASVMKELRERISALLVELPRVFDTADKEAANAVIGEGKAVCKTCDAQIWKLYNDSIAVAEGVTVALLLRYFKRVASHAINIASAVESPVENIDYPLDAASGNKPI